MENITDSFLGLFKNTVNYAIKSIVLVLLSYTFRFLTRWATGALPQMLLQFVIMALGLFILDSLLYLILPPQISAPSAQDCPACQVCPVCPPCNCSCEFAPPSATTV